MKSEPQSFVKTKKNDAFSVFVLIFAESFLLFLCFLAPFFFIFFSFKNENGKVVEETRVHSVSTVRFH